MITKKSNERFCFSNGSYQDFPNVTNDQTAVVVFISEYESSPLDIEAVRSQKYTELSQACESAINGGFMANIMGEFPVHYRTNRDDLKRIERAASVVDGGNVWEGESLTTHTQAQAQLLLDFYWLHHDACSVKYAGLFKAAKDANQHGDFDSIAWGNDELAEYPLV